MFDAPLHLPATLVDRPWFIARERLPWFLGHVSMRGAAIAKMDQTAIDAAVLAASAAPLGRMVGTVAVIPIHGTITQKSDFYSWWYGGTSIERLAASFRQYVNDPMVSAIVFDVDSPGGEVYGGPEFFEEVYAARGQKKLIAVGNPFMASMAYWLPCACDEIVLMPSGQAGSVGCYTMHHDISAMLADAGVKITFIQYGAHKTEGNPYEPLSEAAQAEMQAGVDYYGQLFDKGVAKGRDKTADVIRSTFGQGRVFRSPDAKRIGMVDRIGTLDDVLAKLAPRARGLVAAGAVPASVAAAVDVPTAAPTVAAAVAEDDTVEPNDDGTCPDGYEKGDDGTCRRTSTAASSAAVAQAQQDQDLVDAALGLTEEVAGQR